MSSRKSLHFFLNREEEHLRCIVKRSNNSCVYFFMTHTIDAKLLDKGKLLLQKKESTKKFDLSWSI